MLIRLKARRKAFVVRKGFDDSMKRMDNLREEIKKKYAEAVKSGTSCCGSGECCSTGSDPITADIYDEKELSKIPENMQGRSFGCGSPTKKARLRKGERVLDLGCGTGYDVFLAALETGPEGMVYGLDMTPEMLERARANQKAWGIENVSFMEGYLEDIPLSDDSVDVVISNCVINLSPDKEKVFRQIHRVLAAGGRMAVSDMVFTKPVPVEVRNSLSAWAGCVAGALPEEDYRRMLEEAGFSVVSVERERVFTFSEEELQNLFPHLSAEISRNVSGSLASAFISARKNPS
jgi:ubiquinone/menaquinone biosynthesis C-methylase UbiE